MAISHSAMRRLASSVLLAFGLAACSHDEGPSQFDPDGTSADLASAQVAFDSPVAASFDAAGAQISGMLGGAAAVVMSPATALLHPATARGYAASVARLLPHTGHRLSASVVAIPSAALGVTFAWDADNDVYVASDVPGAPANGVRFLLYAVNPVTRQPAEPLDELGYVDVTDVSSGAVLGTRVVVVAEDVTYLDYTVSGSGTSSSGTITISGLASNGTTRANYTLQTSIAQTSNGMLLTLDYTLKIPSRGFTVNYTATFGNIAPQQVAVTLDFSVSGRNGAVTVSGTYGASGGTFTVKVNGSIFATVVLGTSGDPVITGASGEPLTPTEEAALQSVLDFYDGSLSVFDNLLAPVS